ncbi:hypothetical protein ACSMXN_23765 [Jatrophihabitans sp. DSM 45814]
MLIWYLARGAGIAAFAALSVATAAGAFTARRTGNSIQALDRRVILQYVHRAAALAGLTLLAAHVGLLLADSFAHVGWVGALVPFASGYRPWQVTLGLAACYLLVTVAVTGIVRSRFARSERAVRAWRRIHTCSYLAWASAALHFLVTGTDSGTWWARTVLVGGVGIVALGVLARLAGRPHTDRRLGAPARPVAEPARQIASMGALR